MTRSTIAVPLAAAAALLGATLPLRAAAQPTVAVTPPPEGSIGDITGTVTGLDNPLNYKVRVQVSALAYNMGRAAQLPCSGTRAARGGGTWLCLRLR
jgi:hypothetical protein